MGWTYEIAIWKEVEEIGEYDWQIKYAGENILTAIKIARKLKKENKNNAIRFIWR